MTDFHELAEMIARLILAGILGGLIGYERETHGRPAGLRTHMLVCMGSTVFTIVSISFTGAKSDPARIAAQIVSGIGFLGAGTIIRQGSAIRGLTTAASLWTVAGIGMAAGASWDLALFGSVASIIVFLTLGFINRIEHTTIARSRYRELSITISKSEQETAAVLAAIGAHGAQILGLKHESAEEAGTQLLRLRLRFAPQARIETITEYLSTATSVRSFDWELS